MKIFIGTNEKLISMALLVLRIALGLIFFAHGSQKVLGLFGGKGLDETVAMMHKSLGGPLFLPYLSAFAEFLGGIGILLGLFTRFFGMALLINMCVAVFAVHLKNGFFAPTGFEYPASLGMLALAITLAGPGLFSLDYALFSSRIPRESEDQERIQPPFNVPSGTVQFGPTA
jgi:putative oxidoreductase